MIKVEVIEQFTLQRFDELQNIERVGAEQKGKLFVGDKFECTEELAKYLTGENPLGKVVVKVVEVKPIKEAKIVEEKEKKIKRGAKSKKK